MRTLGFIILLVSLFDSGQAQHARIYSSFLQPESDDSYVTSYPKDDFDPAVSPDGRRLVFTSNRSGNRDLWIKPVRGGQSYQLTKHKADDYSPSWGPDNNKIYFISDRSDAEGDLWQIEFTPSKLPGKKIKVKQIDNYLGYDGQPCCSPDGQWLAFSSTRVSGKQNLWIIKLSDNNVFPVTKNGGNSPDWTFDSKWLVYINYQKQKDATQGDLFVIKFDPSGNFSKAGSPNDRVIRSTNTGYNEVFPVWSKTDYSLFFLRYELDTNKDSQINFEDNPVMLYSVLNNIKLDSLTQIFQSGREIEYSESLPEFHLSCADHYTLYPTITKTNIWFAVREHGQFDIFEIPIDGEIPTFKTAKDQYLWADSTFSLIILGQLQSDEDNFFNIEQQDKLEHFFSRRLLAFQTVREKFTPYKPWSIFAGLEIADEFIRRGEKVTALRLYRELLSEVEVKDSLYVHIKLDLWTAWGFTGEQLLDSLNILSAQLKSDKTAQVNILFYQAKIAQSEENFEETLKITKNIIELVPYESEQYFQALQLQSEVYQSTGMVQKAIEGYLKVLVSSKSDLKQQLIGKKIVKILFPVLADSEETAIRNAIADYVSYPVLSAELQVLFGKYLKQNNNPDDALQNLLNVLDKYPGHKLANFKAGLIATEIFIEKKQTENAMLIFKKLLSRNDLNVIEKLYFKKQIWLLQFELAERLKRQKKFQEAFDLYRILILNDYLQPAAHYGLITCAKNLNFLANLEQEYQLKLNQDPDNGLILYALGQIYSFTEEKNRTGLLKSNDYLERALTRNYQMVYGYIPLSNNYKQLEYLQKQRYERKRNWCIRTTKQIFAPLFWLYRTVTFRKETKRRNWNEQAIEMLTLALYVNDEKSSELEALLYLNLADIYYDLGEFGRENAHRYYLQKRAYDSTFVSNEQKADYYFKLGHCSIILEDWQTAENSLKTAIFLHTELKNDRQAQEAKRLLGMTYQLAGNYERSIQTYTSTINYDEKNGNKRAILETYRNIAYNHLFLENNEKVRQYCLKSLEILQDKNIKKDDRPSTSVRLQFVGYSFPLWNLGNLGPNTSRNLYGFSVDDERALIYTILAENESHRDDFNHALVLMKEKLAVFRKQGDALGQAIVLNNIGMIHLALGNYDPGWRWFELSLERCIEENLLAGEITNLINLSQLLLIVSQFPQDTILQYNTLRIDPNSIRDKINLVINKISEYPFSFLKERVELYHQEGLLEFLVLKNEVAKNKNLNSDLYFPSFLAHFDRFADLIQKFENSADLARKNSLFRKQGVIFRNLGELYQLMDLIPEAEESYERALEIAEKNGYHNLRWRILLSLATIYNNNYYRSDSLGITLLDRSRQILLKQKILNPQKTHDRHFKKDQDQLYAGLIEQYFSREKPKEALLYLDQYQSLKRLDQLHQVDIISNFEKLPPRLLDYLNLLQETDRLENKSEEILRGRRGGYRLFYQVIDSLAISRSDLNDLVQDLQQNDPDLLSLFRPLDFRLKSITSQLQPDQAVFAFYLGADQMISWCLTSDTLVYCKQLISKENVTKLIDQFISGVSAGVFSESLCDSLGEIFLSPFIEYFTAKPEWIIVSENPIAKFPFELLRIEKSFVNNNHKVLYFPSLTDLFLSFRQLQNSGNKVTLVSHTNMLSNTPPISQVEIKHLNPITTTESQFRSVLNKTNYLIINWPLTFVPKPLLLSYFRFQIPQSLELQSNEIVTGLPEENDGYFYLYNFFQQSGNGSFLFLFYPENSSLQDIILTVLRKAGIKAFVSLRWSVSSQVKNDFFSSFLTQLKNNRPFDAFYNAQQEVQKKHENPAIWGAFIWRGFPGFKPQEK